MDPAIFFKFWTCLAFKLNKKLSWIIDVDISEKSVVRITSKKKTTQNSTNSLHANNKMILPIIPERGSHLENDSLRFVAFYVYIVVVNRQCLLSYFLPTIKYIKCISPLR